MPEARLYSAPSHVPASSAPVETLLSNGKQYNQHTNGFIWLNFRLLMSRTIFSIILEVEKSKAFLRKIELY